MKRNIAILHTLALGALLAGCATHDAGTPAATRPADKDSDIRTICAMRQRGEITDAQALRLIAALRGMPLGTVSPATAPAPAPAAAAPALVETVLPTPVPVAPAPAASVNSGYNPRVKLAGRLRSVGSDSMDRIMAEWTRGFGNYHPKLRANHEGKGSSTAVPALLDERADFGPMSRPLKAEEVAQFTARFGYAPTQVRTAIDALAIYVNPANPIAKTGLTLRQIDAIFSATHKREGNAVLTWGDLGLSGDWKDAPVRVYSRNSASGTHVFFRDEVLLKGEFRPDATVLAGSEQLVSAVGADKYAIGYSGIGYKTDEVAAVKVAKDTASDYEAPDRANALSGAYPISRSLYVTINRNPATPATDLQREFVTYILGSEGRAAVEREGYFALPDKDTAAEIAKVR